MEAPPLRALQNLISSPRERAVAKRAKLSQAGRGRGGRGGRVQQALPQRSSLSAPRAPGSTTSAWPPARLRAVA
eukprot:5929303-Pyramimonas_sp.AAC.1